MSSEVNLTFRALRGSDKIDLVASFPPDAGDLVAAILSILALQRTSIDILDGETVEVPA